MSLLRSTMPAALLLLLCVACQEKAGKDQRAFFLAGAHKAKSLSADVSSASSDTAAKANAVTAPGNQYEADYLVSPGVGNDQQKEEKPTDDKAADNKDKKEDRRLPGKPIPVSADWDKKIVKTADLSMEVRNFRNFNEDLHRILQRFGGYIAREEQSQSPYKIGNTAVIKVPVAQFDEAMSLLVPDSAKLLTKKINAEDVTMEVVDTKSRLEAKQKARSRYLDLLKTAKNMDEVLQVQNEIDGIQEQMEAASGRIGYLSHEAAFSTINLDFFQVLDAGAQEDPQPSFFQKLLLSFRSGWEGGAVFLTTLVSVWPLFVLAGLVYWVVRKRRPGKNDKVVAS